MAVLGTIAPVDRTADYEDPLPHVRRTVRSLLLRSPAFNALDADKRRELSQAMVQVCHSAALLVREQAESEKAIARASALSRPASRLSRAQGAGADFSGVSADRVAGTTKAILNAVSFPRFVTELINGVFKAMIDSSQQQMNLYVELLNNVSASLAGFGENNMGDDGARQWLVERFPASFEIVADDSDDSDQKKKVIQLRDGATAPSADALKAALGLGDSDSTPGGDPETSLVPQARKRLAEQRQQMLATMVMLGMQRIVIDSGRITAAMRFHIDTRSAAQDDSGSTLSEKNQVDVHGSYNIGVWGADVKMSNTLTYVSTQKTQTTEEMNTDLDLNSSVELNFRTDYLPLNTMATSQRQTQIQQNTLNPQADLASRAKINADSDAARRQSLDRALNPPSDQPPPAATAPKPAANPAPAANKDDGKTTPQPQGKAPTARKK